MKTNGAHFPAALALCILMGILYASMDEADSLIYDNRPKAEIYRDDQDADTRPAEAADMVFGGDVLKPWILPTANNFIRNEADRHVRPEGDPGSDFPFVQAGYDDALWETVNLPHDWAIAGSFMEGPDSPRSGITSTRHTGGPTCPWRTSCHTGTGRSAVAGSHRSMYSLREMRPNCS